MIAHQRLDQRERLPECHSALNSDAIVVAVALALMQKTLDEIASGKASTEMWAVPIEHADLLEIMKAPKAQYQKELEMIRSDLMTVAGVNRDAIPNETSESIKKRAVKNAGSWVWNF